MTIAEALNILDLQAATLDALAKAYHIAALKYHPDINPHGQEVMKVVNAARDMLKKTFPIWVDIWAEEHRKPETEQTQPIDQELLEILQKIRFLHGVTREIRGVYLWIYGNTKTYKDALKDMGFKWAPKKCEWYYAPNGRKPRRKRGEWSREKIRETYGSDIYAEENRAGAALGA